MVKSPLLLQSVQSAFLVVLVLWETPRWRLRTWEDVLWGPESRIIALVGFYGYTWLLWWDIIVRYYVILFCGMYLG